MPRNPPTSRNNMACDFTRPMCWDSSAGKVWPRNPAGVRALLMSSGGQRNTGCSVVPRNELSQTQDSPAPAVVRIVTQVFYR